MSTPLAFISYSSDDVDAARGVAAALRTRGVDVWIDEEQIRFGDSIPARISEGLRRADVLLVITSQHWLTSSWSRAEYEPLLVKEINDGLTTVVAVRLDDAELPPLLAAKRYVDLRSGFNPEDLDELANTILKGRSYTYVNRALPASTSYEASALSMIVSSTLDQFPVPALRDEQLVQGARLIDLYRTVENLIERYQTIFDELFEVLSASGMELNFVGQADYQPPARIANANRKLMAVAADMREIASHLDRLLARDSALRERLKDVLELCVEIAVVEDFLIIGLTAPPELEVESARSRSFERFMTFVTDGSELWPGDLRSKPLRDMLRDITRVRTELDEYQRQLRSAVARVRVTESP